MKITVEVNVRENASPDDILEWLARGRAIDAGPAIMRSFAIGEVGTSLVGTEEQVDRRNAAVDETGDPVDEDAGSVDGAAQDAPPGVKPAGSKRGPRAGRAASKTAEEQAAALVAQQQAAPTAGFEPPPGAAPPGVVPNVASLPPGVTQNAAPPGVVANAAPPGVAAPAAPQVTEPAVSMPKADGNPTLDANGHMRLEDFRAECMLVQNEAKARGRTAAFPFNVLRAEKWPDGTEKGFATMQIDMCPPEHRRTLLDHCMMVLNA